MTKFCIKNFYNYDEKSVIDILTSTFGGNVLILSLLKKQFLPQFCEFEVPRGRTMLMRLTLLFSTI